MAGITRATLIEIARDKGYTVTERRFSLTEALAADEAFFTGTAAEVTPIGSIDDCPLSGGKAGPISLDLKASYLDAVRGKTPKYEKFLTFVK